MEKCSFCSQLEEATVLNGECYGCLFVKEQNERDWEADAEAFFASVLDEGYF